MLKAKMLTKTPKVIHKYNQFYSKRLWSNNWFGVEWLKVSELTKFELGFEVCIGAHQTVMRYSDVVCRGKQNMRGCRVVTLSQKQNLLQTRIL